MTAEQLATTMIERCKIYYGEALLSKESIIADFIRFYAGAIMSDDCTVGFSLHTGSPCFDATAIVATAFGCLSYNMLTADDIIAGIQDGDMVMFKGERYRWRGIGEHPSLTGYPSCFILEQDGKGKNGKSTCYYPYEKNKHLIKPYYGTSKKTNGRGIRKSGKAREEFLAYLWETDIADIPTEVDVSVVLLYGKESFTNICKQIHIVYDDDKKIDLIDIIPTSYYTGSGEELQLGKNPTKSEAVIKVAGHISTARELILDRSGNTVIGALITGVDSMSDNGSELADILRRKSLKFAHVLTTVKTEIEESVLEQYPDAPLYACTREYLAPYVGTVDTSNSITAELSNQICRITNSSLNPINVDGGISWEKYRSIKNKIFQIKQSNRDFPEKEAFIKCAHGLLNLFTYSVFPMRDMETAVESKKLVSTVAAPSDRIKELLRIAEKETVMQDTFLQVALELDELYHLLFELSPKSKVLKEYIRYRCDHKIAVIVPKAYYADIILPMIGSYGNQENVVCVTANRFRSENVYDYILVVGDVAGKHFDPTQCMASSHIDVLLYDCEGKAFHYRRKKSNKIEQRINAKLTGTEFIPASESENTEEEILETDVKHFVDLDEYIDSLGSFDLRKYISSGTASSSGVTQLEVKHLGIFTTGEQIFFSRYYSAVVFNGKTSTVQEKKPEELLPGDILVFTQNNDYTKNTVDYIFDSLIARGRLSPEVCDAAEKTYYWKEILREYKEKNGYTYRGIAKRLIALGCPVKEISVRQWLVADSHIIGPRDEKTLSSIAQLTQDPYLLSDTAGYFEACRIVRHERRNILSLISNAISDKLSGRIPQPESVLEVVYDNVEHMSETLELERIDELDESINVNMGLVNRPISEAEVSI